MGVNKHNIEICALTELKKKGKGNRRYQNYILFYRKEKKKEQKLEWKSQYRTNLKTISTKCNT